MLFIFGERSFRKTIAALPYRFFQLLGRTFCYYLPYWQRIFPSGILLLTKENQIAPYEKKEYHEQCV